MPLSNAAVRDIETVLHPYTNLAAHRETGPMVLGRASGVYVHDESGRPLIEGMAGLWCASLGYGNEELVEVAAEQMRKLSYTHLFSGKSHDPAIELAEKLKEVAPVPMSKVFFTSSGSEANDTQVKIAWYINNGMGRPRKKKIISRWKGYHGVTVASASLTGLPYNHMDFDLPLPGILHAAAPHHYRGAEPGESEEDYATRLADELEAMIVAEDPDTVAAFIAEPVMGAGGVIVPPATYFEKVQAVLDRHDVLMIVDEVITGFGRTGRYWGSDTYGIRPNTLSCAKALTSAYFPVGAVMVDDGVYQALVDESRKIGVFGHGYTYSGHPVGAAIAVKTLEIYARDKLIEKAAAKSPQFQRRLARLAERELVGEARGVGLVGAIEVVADKRTKAGFDAKAGVPQKIVKFCEEEGVILRAIGGTAVAVCPPLVITEAEIDELFDRFERGLDRAEAWVAKEGLKAGA
jgi:4-aminobutyrate--pyruvate transaminase